ncbi:MAG: transcriptional regulator BetI [Rhodospirillaceae bacterium]|nr:transcriptional regulator BetI [Rhodospirillaceae bacterium]
MAKAEASKEVRRKQLIDATMRAIGRYGYASLTLTHVAGEAGLSPGIVNFYFKSKDQLLIATLENIAEEYSGLWQGAIAKGRVSPAAGLAAMIDADFHASVCNPEKVSVWYAFWAEARNNPHYQSLVMGLEDEYLKETEQLCARIVAEGGYDGVDALQAAVGLNAMIDGLWFDCLMSPSKFDRAAAKRTCLAYLAAVFPAHFGSSAATRRGKGEIEPAIALAIDQDVQGRDAHRARLAAALRKRLEPVGPMRREALAAATGVSLKVLESWLEGRAEPTSWQMGRLLVAVDAQLWMEVYGPVHEEAQRLFEAKLAQQREFANREQASLDALGGKSKDQK